MAAGKRRQAQQARRRRTSIGVGLLILAVGGGAVWFFLLRDTRGGHPVPDFSFELHKVNAAAIGAAPGSEALQEGAEGVRATIDALYVAGFIDPDKWEDGAFPEVLEQFDGAAARQAEGNLQVLTLGDAAAEVEFIEPALGTMNIRFLVDATRRLTAAVAVTRFVADGEDMAGRSLFVRHDGTYYLQPDEDGRWLIVGYDVSGEVQPGRRGGTQPTATEGTP
jgi:hypothetical protein